VNQKLFPEKLAALSQALRSFNDFTEKMIDWIEIFLSEKQISVDNISLSTRNQKSFCVNFCG
jgi:hypothetical protein